MNLKDYIKTTILSINNAIIESQLELKDNNIIINPENITFSNNGNKYLNFSGERYVQDIEFDICINIEDKEEKGGKGELKIVNIIGAGGSLKNESNLLQTNRIKFSIPVSFSTSQTPRNYNKSSRVT